MKKLLLLLMLFVVAGALASLPLYASEVPDKAELKKMSEESMAAFGQALKDKDFSGFYIDIAAIWQKQTSPEKLQEAFKDMLGGNFDILGIVKELKPVFDPAPQIDSDGVLIIKGYYPTKPNRLTFQLKYLEEEAEWKLVGINVKTEETPGAESKEKEGE